LPYMHRPSTVENRETIGNNYCKQRITIVNGNGRRVMILILRIQVRQFASKPLCHTCIPTIRAEMRRGV